jgi:hypothetical protein
MRVRSQPERGAENSRLEADGLEGGVFGLAGWNEKSLPANRQAFQNSKRDFRRES